MQEWQIEKDRKNLHRLGYVQELYRTIDGFSSFAISFSIISILSGLLTHFGFGLKLAGPATVWTWAVVGFFNTLLAFSLGEIASAFPLAGGVYKWVRKLAGVHVGWFTGWISFIGWLGVTAGIDFGLGLFLTSYIGLDNSNLQIVLWVTGFIVLLHTFLNVFGIKIVAWFNDFSVTVHIVGVIALVGLLLAFGQKNPVSIVFNTGNVPPGYFWFGFTQALLMSAWTLTAFDASASVSEESINPSQTVPWGMISAVVVSWFFGALLLLSLDLALPDLNTVLRSEPTATMEIVKTALGPTLSKFIMAIVQVAMFTAGLSSLTVTVRIIFTMSRDNGFPFSKLLKYVSPKYDTPIYSVLFAGGTTIVLCTLGAVLPVITSLSTFSIYLSYAVALLAALWAKRKGEKYGGAFMLGRFSTPLQIVSLIWTVFISFDMLLAPYQHTWKFFLAIIVTLLGYYLLFMRKNLAYEYRHLSETELEELEVLRGGQ